MTARQHSALADPPPKARQLRRGARLSLRLSPGRGLVAFGWGVLVMQTRDAAQFGALSQAGPGMHLLDWLRFYLFNDIGARIVAGVPCTSASDWSIADTYDTALMWAAMVIAMMLPRRLALRSNSKSGLEAEELVGECRYLAGYLVGWIPFCVLGVTAQFGLMRFDLMSGWMVLQPLGAKIAILAAAIFLWHVVRGEHPSSGTSSAATDFASGLLDGWSCSRTCLPVMGAMFAMGLMNIVAMMAFTILDVICSKHEDLRQYLPFVLLTTAVAATL